MPSSTESWQQRLSHSRSLALLGLAGTSLFWAGNALVARYMSTTLPPFTMAFWRWSLSLAILSPFVYKAWRSHRDAIRRYRWQLLILAWLSVTSFNSLLYQAAQATTAINITLVNSLSPVATLILSFWLLRYRASRMEFLGIAIAMMGALAIILHGNLQSLLALTLNPGDLTMLIGVFTWSLYSVLLRKWSLPIPTFNLFCLLVAIGTPFILPLYLWEFSREGGVAIDQSVVLAILYVGLFPSIFAYVLWNHGIAVVGPSLSAAFSYLTPVLAAAIAIPFLGESLESYHWIGALLTLSGLFLANRRT